MATLFVSAGALAGTPGSSPFDRHADHLLSAATAFEHGEGVPRDPERAAACYCESARLGNAEAMFALGWMYANGRGLPRDDGIAGTLFAMAAMLDHPQAARMQGFTGPYTGAVPACLEAPLWEKYDGMVERVMARLGPERREVAHMVTTLAPDYGVEPRLALAIAAVESAFNPAAVSPKNAMGVMQLIPATAERFNVGNAYDARQNVSGGLRYLRWLLAYFKGDVRFVAAAYNAGEGAVERYRGVPPYAETRAYVERVLGYYRRTDHPYDRRVADASPMLERLRIASQ
ncbi:MAG: transglycosylase SLT domain-containing protein [Rhodocyclaceae bacterium]|nr:transglycosylase SLT domain-containing protein [Rhodocyclaceae bacterium]